MGLILCLLLKTPLPQCLPHTLKPRSANPVFSTKYVDGKGEDYIHLKEH